MDLSFLHDRPSRYLRSVAADFGEIIKPAPTGPTAGSEENEEKQGWVSYEECIIKTLAARARRLEHLEIRAIVNRHLYIPTDFRK